MAASFDEAKRGVLAKIDISSKGSFDEPILDLLSLINSHRDLVTTSSCSGRIAVFVSKAAAATATSDKDMGDYAADAGNVSSALAKGIKWLLVSHGVVTVEAVKQCIAHAGASADSLTMLKCECLILHIQCRYLLHLHHLSMY